MWSHGESCFWTTGARGLTAARGAGTLCTAVKTSGMCVPLNVRVLTFTYTVVSHTETGLFMCTYIGSVCMAIIPPARQPRFSLYH
jgi:hypothetical protein